MFDAISGTDDRSGQLRRALDHYNGNPKRPLERRQGEPDDNLILSLARLVVDKGASFLFGQPIEFQLGDGDGGPQGIWLTECWRRNKRGILLQKLATNGGIFGHAFLRILESEPFPRLIILDPQTVEVMTDPEDIDSVWRFTITPPPAPVEEGEEPIKRRTVIESPSGQAGYRVAVPPQWSIIDQEFRGSAWVPVESSIWPYPFCPVLHCQNLPKANDFWGEADLPADILTLLDGINRVASHYNKIIRLHAHPKVWTRGMGTRTLDFGIDSVLHLPSETAELKALEMQSDLASTMALLEKLLNLLSMMSRIPLVAMGMPDNLGAISGVALQIRYQPLIEKTESKRLTYGDLLVELDRCLLAMGEWGDTTITQLVWPEILPSDLLEERQVAVLDDSLKVASRQTLAEKFGYDWQQEQDRIVEEKKADIAAGLVPDPSMGVVPEPAALQAPNPDIAKTAKSK